MKLRVAVLMGGNSAEREVSLDSGRAIAKALSSVGHEVTLMDVASGAKPRRSFLIRCDSGQVGLFRGKQMPVDVKSRPEEAKSNLLNSEQFAQSSSELVLDSIQPLSVLEADVAFLAFHGGFGENGGIQALLEMAGIPYTGSGPLASAIGMDKHISKLIFRQVGVNTAPWIFVNGDAPLETSELMNRINTTFGLPCVVKPNNQGSTIGVSVVEDEEQLGSAMSLANEYSSEIIVEKYIPGRDLTVAILDQFKECCAEALPVIEIRPKHRVYDYECKYIKGMSEYIVPAQIPKSIEKRIKYQALKAYQALKCKGYARIDFRFNPTEGLFCLEVNTLPGMTETSLIPMAAEAAGIGFPELVDRIAKLALKRQGRN